MAHVITASEHDSSRATLTAAQADLVSSRAALDLRRQALEDATVESPLGGTVVSRPTTQGTIITSATSANGGTTLMTIADLGRVRMRVTIDEVEMANVRVGESATVAVDAFPDHVFDGVVEKIEPQAVVTQGVTFFQALVSISNKEGLLMPGMNGEVTIRAADLSQVIQLPIDAIRPTNELAPVARMFGLSVDTHHEPDAQRPARHRRNDRRAGAIRRRRAGRRQLRDATGQDRPDRPACSAGHGRRERGRQGRDAGRDHHGETGGSADAPARGQYPPRADATGVGDPGGRDRHTGRSTRGSEPAEAGGSEAKRGTDAGRASGINQETVKATTGSLFGFSYLLATGTACVHPPPSIDGSAASPTQRGRGLESFVERRQRGGA